MPTVKDGSGILFYDFVSNKNVHCLVERSRDLFYLADSFLIALKSASSKMFFVTTPLAEGTITSFNHNANNYDAYWYHSDHLGSSSYITNLNGIVTQHMEYLPFGELMVDEHQNSNNTPYKFNGKELDDETGNYYYGARYYNPKFSIWLSVDPLTEKYPSYSPYNYTLNNPVNLVDPDGRSVEKPECCVDLYNYSPFLILLAKNRIKTFLNRKQGGINFYSKYGTNKNQRKGDNHVQSINADDIIAAAKTGTIRHSKGSALLKKISNKKIDAKSITKVFKMGYKDAKNSKKIVEDFVSVFSEKNNSNTEQKITIQIFKHNAKPHSKILANGVITISFNKDDTLVHPRDEAKTKTLSKRRIAWKKDSLLKTK